MKSLFAAGALIAALGAVYTANAGEVRELSFKSAETLASYEPTGETRSCISVREIQSMKPLDDQLILVKTISGDYLNQTNGTCSRAAQINNRLEYRMPVTQLCEGEIVKVVQNTSGIFMGSCSLGAFQELERMPVAG